MRKALALGADRGVLVSDDGLHGSDAMATAGPSDGARRDGVRPRALLGSESTDARTSLVPQALAQHLGLPGLTNAKKVDVDGSSITIHRERRAATRRRGPAAGGRAVVKGINEPRYPSLKGIMGAKQKPVETKSAADVGVDAAAVGLSGSGTEVLAAEPRPPKEKGTIVTDQGGDGAAKLADFLQAQKFI